MTLPLQPPLAPMLAKLTDGIPDGDGWLYEPKWDGFRCVVFRDGDDIELASRNERPFTRYFPELLDPLRAVLPDRAVVDGEIVVPAADDAGLDFDALLQRIHPAESRVRRLAAETPASFVAFDLLAEGDESFLDTRWPPATPGWRRHCGSTPPSRSSCARAPPTSRSPAAGSSTSRAPASTASIAKRLADPYTPDKRTLIKVKHRRTADCVVAGYRVHKDGQGVGSLLLGLYDDDRPPQPRRGRRRVQREAPRRAARRGRAADPRCARWSPVA